MKKLKILGLVLGSTLLVLLFAVLAFKAWSDAHFYDGYPTAYPLDYLVRERADALGGERVDFQFTGPAGDTVPAMLFTPASAKNTAAPCVVFLHGIGQSVSFLPEIAKPFLDAGFVIVSYDQYTRGERKNSDINAWETAKAFRRRGALTVLDTRVLLDVLETLDTIDADRLYLVGASYGAIMGSTAAAMDERFKAATLVYGGGDIKKLVNSRAGREETGKWMGLVASLMAWFMAPSDPVKYVADISPRPLFVQNGKEDQLIPTEAAQALFDAAKEPKEQRWYEGDHVGMDEATTRQVLDDALAWIVDIDTKRE